MSQPARIVVVGAGWWSQGWHIPQLHRNPKSALVAIVDSGLPMEPTIRSGTKDKNGQAHLLSLSELAEKYQTRVFTSVEDLFQANDVRFDGVVIATPHAAHYGVAMQFLGRCHILLEKPMTTDVDESHRLWELQSQQHAKSLELFVNHTANFRPQTMVARDAVVTHNALGRIRHVSVTMASALTWLFDDPLQTTWTQITSNSSMLGNGFGWGQLTHAVAWICYVCPSLRPKQVLACHMVHSDRSGADVAVSGTVLWEDCRYTCGDGSDTKADVTMSISGTSLLPGNEHSDPPIGKLFDFQIYGDQGALIYRGDTRSKTSGDLQIRRVATDGKIELPCGDAGFEFENCEPEGNGPESMEQFLDACQGTSGYRVAADALVGLRTIQVIDALYRSHHSGQPETVKYADCLEADALHIAAQSQQNQPRLHS